MDTPHTSMVHAELPPCHGHNPIEFTSLLRGSKLTVITSRLPSLSRSATATDSGFSLTLNSPASRSQFAAAGNWLLPTLHPFGLVSVAEPKERFPFRSAIQRPVAGRN